MIRKLLNALDPVIEAELDRARFQSGDTFSSPHEGYAVIKEELEECSEELIRAHKVLGELWSLIRDDTPVSDVEMNIMKSHARSVAAEAVQVAAMCEKYIASNAKWLKEAEENA